MIYRIVFPVLAVLAACAGVVIAGTAAPRIPTSG